jgi:hypothetical protein
MDLPIRKSLCALVLCRWGGIRFRRGYSNDVFHPHPVTKGEVPPESFFQTINASDEYPISGLDALNFAVYPF